MQVVIGKVPRRWVRCIGLLGSAVALGGSPLALAAPAPAVIAAPTTWSAPALVDHGAPFATPVSINAISCPTASLCVAGDNGGDIVSSADPRGGPAAWHRTPTGFKKSIVQVTCAGSTFCLAEMFAGEESTVVTSTDPTGGTQAWHGGRRLLPLTRFTCPSEHLCAAPDGRKILISTDPGAGSAATWNTITLAQTGKIEAVSCPAASFCVAVDNVGNVYSTSHPTGRAPAWKRVFVDHDNAFLRLSCPSKSFCAAVDSASNLVYSANPGGRASGWKQTTAPAAISSTLTCLSSAFCYGLGSAAEVSAAEVLITDDPAGGASSWQLTDIDETANLASLTCATAHFCAAVADGDVDTTTAPLGGAAGWKATEADGFTSIESLDCPVSSMCVAGDDEGDILSSADPSGGVKAWRRSNVDGTAFIDAISCPTITLCVATDKQGDVLWSTHPAGGATQWHVTSVDNSEELLSVACPAASLCVASGNGGEIWVSSDPTGGAAAWQEATIGTSADDVYVSCPSTTRCFASAQTGIFTSTDPGGGASAWPVTVSLDAEELGPIDCPTPSLCVAVGAISLGPNEDQASVIFSSDQPTGGPNAWRSLAEGSEFTGGGVTVSCPSASLCLAGVVDDFGLTMLASRDPAGGRHRDWQPTGISATAVSCPTVTRCFASDLSGDVLTGSVLVPTTTSIRSVPGSAMVGQRITVRVRVERAAAGPAGVPGGAVTIRGFGGGRACEAKLRRSGDVAVGACGVVVRSDGTHVLTARYGGNGTFAASVSGGRTIRVRS